MVIFFSAFTQAYTEKKMTILTEVEHSKCRLQLRMLVKKSENKLQRFHYRAARDSRELVIDFQLIKTTLRPRHKRRQVAATVISYEGECELVF